ncbi:MAG TPA: hypothetical protein VF212_00725 [Longimicrobiales bacterium]
MSRFTRFLPALLIAVPATACYPALELVPSDADVVLAHHSIDAPDPAAPGPYRVLRLTYGSGTDKRRPEYRDSVAFRTPTVDASKLVKLSDEQAEERGDYWGFGPDSFPLNARVWYPDGEGPFPLVLVVHGNHDMKDFSDPGYDYLGELLASRGYILASVDENFLNGSIRQENDGRAFMLLEHLKAWRGFNADPDNPFHRKVDMSRIALIGHSRGGEAVGHAAAFNRLSRYPDDANVVFDYGFDIRSIVAIAPVDGQYRPAEKLVPVEDVNYLVFHGSHDGDVTSFMGIRQYQRVRFSGDAPRFKAAVYVYRANHGQWNTVWGANDNGPRSGRILDLRALLDPADQRRIAEVYISAFLEATLRDDDRYLPLFRDHRTAGGWLPKTMYITRFHDSDFRPVATFEEDIDVTTASIAGATLNGDSLATWKESGLDLRSANSPAEGSSQGNNAVTLGWNNRIAAGDGEAGPEDEGRPEDDVADASLSKGGDRGAADGSRHEPGDAGAERATRLGPPASYTLTLPDTLAAAWNLAGDGAALSFLLAPTFDVPDPREAPEDTAAALADKAAKSTDPGRREAGREGRSARDRERRDDRDDDDPEKDRAPVELTLELVDRDGDRARLPLGRYGVARKPLTTYVLRRRDREEERFENHWELVLQSYTVPLADFRAENPALDLHTLRQVRFVFDRTPAGTVVLDEIGFSAPPPTTAPASVAPSTPE